MVKKKLDAMPNKLILKTKPLDGSTPTTPTETTDFGPVLDRGSLPYVGFHDISVFIKLK